MGFERDQPLKFISEVGREGQKSRIMQDLMPRISIAIRSAKGIIWPIVLTFVRFLIDKPSIENAVDISFLRVIYISNAKYVDMF